MKVRSALAQHQTDVLAPKHAAMSSGVNAKRIYRNALMVPAFHKVKPAPARKEKPKLA
jgi:hypothetical protein